MYRPEKRFFTEQDFDQMGWHNNPIHAVAFGPGPGELTLDIDYIFKCAQPSGAAHSTFWVSPATLVFKDVFGLRTSHSGPAAPTILDIQREEVNPRELRLPQQHWKWRIACVDGEWTFCASGYCQHIRRPPELVSHPRLDPGERGGYQLTCPTR